MVFTIDDCSNFCLYVFFLSNYIDSGINQTSLLVASIEAIKILNAQVLDWVFNLLLDTDATRLSAKSLGRQMRLACSCGSVIVDTTDFLPDKAHLIADRDWEDFLASTEPPRRIAFSHVRNCYQCAACGTLYVEDPQQPDSFHAFVPVGKNVSVLQSSKGAAWRAPMGANWFDNSNNGWLFCSADDVCMHRSYDNWIELEAAYYALFQKMQNENRIRHSFLRRNGITLHSWQHEA
jgi:hypothetical protein